MAKGKNTKKIISIVASALVLLYMGFQLHSVLNKGISTEFAVPYTYNQKISATGYVVRDEEIIASEHGGGVVGYCQQNGSKVAAGSVVAEVFSTEDQANAKNRISEIDSSLEKLKDLQESGKQYAVSAELLNLKINERINNLLNIADSGSFNGFDDACDDLLESMNKKQIATGSLSGFESSTEQLKSEKASLESIVGTPSQITCQKSGYFVNQVDGHENRITVEALEKMTVDELSAVENIEVSKSSNAVGKVISGNEWYIAAVLENKDIKQMSLGDEIKIYIPTMTSNELLCSVAFMNVDYAAEKTMVAFKCNRMETDLSDIRIESIEVCVNTYQGLRVKSSAVRIIEGVTGVYVISGINADFKTVELLYSDSVFAVCKVNSDSSSGLKIYDEVIVDGSDLYDGKTVK